MFVPRTVPSRHMALFALTTSCALAALLSGCMADEAAQPATTTTSADACGPSEPTDAADAADTAVGADATSATEVDVATAVDATPDPVVTERFVFASFGAPLANHVVRVTRADGTVEEPSTDAEGKLTVADVDGPLTLVVAVTYDTQAVPTAFVSFRHADWGSRRGADGVIRIVLREPYDLTTATLRLESLSDAAHYVKVSTNVVYKQFELVSLDTLQGGDVATVGVPSAGPVHVVARQMVENDVGVIDWGAATFASLAGMAGASLPLGTLEPKRKGVWIAPPSFGDAWTRYRGTVTADWDGPIEVGLATSSAPSAAGKLIVGMQWVEPPGATSYETTVGYSDSQGRSSVASQPGVPDERTFELMEPPSFATEPTSWGSLTTAPPTVEKPAGARTSVSIFGSFDIVGSLEYGADVTTLTLPLRPGGEPFSAAPTEAVTYDLWVEEVLTTDGVTTKRSASPGRRTLTP